MSNRLPQPESASPLDGGERMSEWSIAKLTVGSEEGRFHAHSYYDVPVFDSGSRYVAGHRLTFAGRHPEPHEAVGIGVIDTVGDGGWMDLGESRAWSWQQGPLTQWLPGRPRLAWNDREGDRFVARIHDLNTSETRALPMPVYAVHPQGAFALSLNMARLDAVRPGYGYPGGAGARLEERAPKEDGVWKVDLETGSKELILDLDRAVRFLKSQQSFKERFKAFRERYIFWFNHAKFSPSGNRFTVKLRFRSKDSSKGWNDQQGVSLTCGIDGQDLRLLTRGASHVIWRDDGELYLWQSGGVYRYADEAPQGRRVGQIAPGLIEDNVHIRHMPGEPDRYVFDTPYREEIDLLLFDARSGASERIGRFSGHTPKRGPFRCDLHPCPSPDGRKLVVTSLQDGGRQIYLLRRG